MAKQRRKVTLDLYGLAPEAADPVRFRNRSAMVSEWRDPDDSAPSARKTARQVRGHRHFDPIRQHVQRFGQRSPFTSELVEVADLLRCDHDGGRIGFSGGLGAGLPVSSVAYGPALGPCSTAQRQMYADAQFRSAWALLESPQDRAVVSLVILGNVSFSAAAKALGVRRDGLSARVAGVLVTLREHYDGLELGRRRAA